MKLNIPTSSYLYFRTGNAWCEWCARKMPDLLLLVTAWVLLLDVVASADAFIVAFNGAVVPTEAASSSLSVLSAPTGTESRYTACDAKFGCCRRGFFPAVLRAAANTASEKDGDKGGEPVSGSKEDYGFDGLNPLEQRSVPGTGGVVGSAQISVRQLKMKELMSELLRVADSVPDMRLVLARYEGFLMEQFDDLDARLEPGSIFNSAMGRSARFDRYDAVMKERVGAAQSGMVRKVLEEMAAFVMEHDDRNRDASEK